MSELVIGLRTAFASREYRIGGVIGPTALKYLDAEMTVFSLIMATLVALLFPLMV